MKSSNAELYGKGIFTTIRVIDGKPWLWEKHWQRLADNARALRVDLSDFNEDTTFTALKAAIKTNSLISGRARLTFYDDRPSDIWPSGDTIGPSTGLSILTGPQRTLPDPFNVGISPFPVNSQSPLAGVKSCNYLEQVMAHDEAKTKGFHEAIRVNERGHVTSGCMSNVFWEDAGKLFTPSLATGCLGGTTREYILDNTACEEVEADIGAIQTATAIFLTSAGLGIAHVAEFNGRSLDRSQLLLSEGN